MDMDEALLTADEVADILKVSRSYAFLMMRRGDIPIVRMGRSIRVRRIDLMAFVSSRLVTEATPSIIAD